MKKAIYVRVDQYKYTKLRKQLGSSSFSGWLNASIEKSLQNGMTNEAKLQAAQSLIGQVLKDIENQEPTLIPDPQ